MLRIVLVAVAISVASAAQTQSTPITQTFEMLKSADEVVGRVARLGGFGGGLAILLPVFLCIGFFAFIIPFFAILFLGAGTFGGGGGQGWGGAAGLYPAGRKLAEMIPGLPLNNEQLVQAMTFLDAAFTEFGSKMIPSGTLKSSTLKKKNPSAKSLDQGVPPTATTASPRAEGRTEER